jgi:hypothetical protein
LVVPIPTGTVITSLLFMITELTVVHGPLGAGADCTVLVVPG